MSWKCLLCRENESKEKTTDNREAGKPRGGPRCALDRARGRKGGHGAMSLGLGLQGNLVIGFFSFLGLLCVEVVVPDAAVRLGGAF